MQKPGDVALTAGRSKERHLELVEPGRVIGAPVSHLVEVTNAPVVTTLMARGAFPDSHELHLGMPGMHGSVAAVTAFQKADLLITLGARFDDRVTGRLDTFAPDAKVIHADIDPAEIGKNRAVDVPIVGDIKEVLVELVENGLHTYQRSPLIQTTTPHTSRMSKKA